LFDIYIYIYIYTYIYVKGQVSGQKHKSRGSFQDFWQLSGQSRNLPIYKFRDRNIKLAAVFRTFGSFQVSPENITIEGQLSGQS